MDPSSDTLWRAVLARDENQNGAFVYAVRSTGVFCRPSCPSRRPRRANVVFFPVPEAARRAGFRPCKRCRPQDAAPADPRLAAVREACRAIDEADGASPTLADLGARTGMSPTHLQRVFKRAMGISPREYGDARRHGRMRARLRRGDDIAGALYESGYGSISRLYEGAEARFGMTPASYRRGGAGASIVYTIADSPLDRLLVAATERGICLVALGDDDGELTGVLEEEFPEAARRRDNETLGPWVRAILAHLAGREPDIRLPLDVRATAFQWRVWRELTRIPYGERRSYGQIAAMLGQPRGARAVGRACATNPVSLLIPCHRAVREDGSLAGYRWGVERKAALLEREAAGRKRPASGPRRSDARRRTPAATG